MEAETVTDWNGQVFDVLKPEDRPQVAVDGWNAPVELDIPFSGCKTLDEATKQAMTLMKIFGKQLSEAADRALEEGVSGQ
jgi:hypothetical protein